MNTNSTNLIQYVKQAEIKKYPDESRWAICPYCGKRALPLQKETEIKDYLHKCQGSNCRKKFLVNVKCVESNCGKDFILDIKK